MATLSPAGERRLGGREEGHVGPPAPRACPFPPSPRPPPPAPPGGLTCTNTFTYMKGCERTVRPEPSST